MKKIVTKLLALGSIGLLMLSACKKDGTLTTSNGGKAGTLTASSMTPVLDKAKLNDTTSIINFSFTAPNYGYSAAVTNTLQIDAPGDNWKNPTSATLATKVYSQGYSTGVFNALLLKLNLPAGVASQVNVRVSHSISSTAAPIYSNVLSLTVTPFNLASYMYVPGAYEGSSWPNPGPMEDSLLSATDNGVYVGIIPFTAGNNQFLVTPAKNWANKYATNDAPGTISSTVAYNGPNNFYAPVKATVDPAVNITTCQVTLDINKNTISFLPIQWSVVGDATPGGWPNGSGYQSDTDMKYNNGTQTWSVVVALQPGGIKFRLNHDWGTNYGSLTTPGVLDTQNNNNIAITTAGNYLVTVDINHLTYSVVKQ